MGQQPLVGQGLPVVEVPRSHSENLQGEFTFTWKIQQDATVYQFFL